MNDFGLEINNERPIDAKGKDPPDNCKFKWSFPLNIQERNQINFGRCAEDLGVDPAAEPFGRKRKRFVLRDFWWE